MAANGWIWIQRVLLVVTGVALGLGLGHRASGYTIQVPGWGEFWTSAMGIGALGVAFGVAASTVLRSLWTRIWKSREPPAGVIYGNPILGGVTFAVLAAMVAFVDSGMRAGLLGVDRAVLALAMGAMLLLSAVVALAAIQRGDSVEVETHWGGIGGSLGGWRVSPLAVLILFVLVFAVGSAALLAPRSSPAIADGASSTGR